MPQVATEKSGSVDAVAQPRHKSRCGIWFAAAYTGAASGATALCLALCLGLLPDLAGGRLLAQSPAGPALTVTGTLVDEEGAPTPRLVVKLRPYPNRYERRLHELGDPRGLPAAVDSTRSGGNGAFTLTAPVVGVYRLDIAVAAGGAAPDARDVVPAAPVYHTLAPFAAPIVLPPIEVPSWHAFAVGATGPEGQPVEGALVVVDPATRGAECTKAGHEPWDRRQERVHPCFGRASARTDAGGLARFSMPTAEADVLVSAPGFRLKAGPVNAPGGTFELTPGAGVTVRVLDPQGRPAARAALTVRESLEAPLALTDDRGEATVGLAADRSLIYRAVGEDHCHARTAPLAPEPGDGDAPRSVEVRLAPPAEIAGRVADATTGRPVPGAVVWSRPGEWARSGPAGGFLLHARLYRGQAKVGVAADGYQATVAAITAARLRSADGVDLVLSPSATLRGEVIDTRGQPVAGASLRIEPSGGSGGFSVGPGGWNAISAFDGSFFMAGAASRHAYRLHVEADGYTGRTLEIPAVPVGTARKHARVVLTRGQRVSGIITDTQGVPISGVEVALHPVATTRDGGYSWRSSSRTSSTDARGGFVFPGTPTGRHELTANHPDHVSLTALAFDVPSGEGAKNLGTLTLAAGAPIEGVVRGVSGEPVEGARVSAFQKNPRRLLDADVRTAVTDADGAFRIGGLRAEPADLVVEAQGYAPFDMTAVRPRTGSLVEIRLSEGARLTGRVVRADSRGAANVFVVLNLEHSQIVRRTAWSPMSPGHDYRSLGHHARTDDDGRFRFDSLGRGPWSVQVAGEHLSNDAGAIRLRPGEQREIEVHLHPRSRLVGMVIDPSGSPVTGAEVVVQSLDSAGEPASTDSSPVTDAGGGYEADSVPPGPARVVARHPAYRDGVREVVIGPGTNEVDLEFRRGWEISGSVTNAGGTRVALATVEADQLEPAVSRYDPAGAWRDFLPRPLQAVTDENGTWRIGGLDNGRYDLRVEAEGYALASPSRVQVEGRSVAGVDFVLHRGSTLRGVVTGRPPQAFGGISVSARQEQLLGGVATPDFEGRFQLDELGPGTWTVRAVERDGRTIERLVSLETGPGEVFVELSFEAGFTLTGEIRSDGQLLAGSEVAVVEGGRWYGSVHTARIDRQNRFQVDGLAAGACKVMITEPSGVTHSRQIELQGDQDIVVVLNPPAVLAGVVVDRTTREPLADVSVVAIAVDPPAENALAEEEWTTPPRGQRVSRTVPVGYTQSNADGEFRLQFAPGTSTTLVVERAGYRGVGLPLDLVSGERREGYLIELQPR